MSEHETIGSRLVAIVTLFSLVLVRLPVLVGEGTIKRVLVLSPFLFAIAWLLPRRDRGRMTTGPALLVMLLVVMIDVSLVRGARLGVYSTTTGAVRDALTFTVVLFFGLALFATKRAEPARGRAFACVAFAPAVYITVNVLLHVFENRLPFSLPADTNAVVSTPAQLLGLFGIHTDRVQFPLALGVNNFGAIAAAGLASSLVLLLRRVGPRTSVSVAAGAVCLYGALATDSRAALLLALAIVLLFAVTPRLRASTGIWIVLPLSPAILVAALSFISSSGLVSIFSRTGDDLLTGSGRLLIWEAAWNVLRRPSLDHAFGYGAGGQVTSGAYGHYEFLFGSATGTFTIHNLALQTILDMGYMGLATLVLVSAICVVRLERLVRRTPATPATAVLAVLLVLLFSGTTEALPTYNFPDTLALALLVFAAAAVVDWRVQEEFVPDERAPEAEHVPVAVR
jgi:O-antigen ligase